MAVKIWLQLAAFVMVVVLTASVFAVWQDVRRQQANLEAKLAATQQQLQAADVREETRKTQLQQQLAKIAQQEKKVQNPEQVIQALPNVLPLPKPLVIDDSVIANESGEVKSPSGERKNALPPKVQLPAEDLKPLYDYALACKACEAQLATAQADLKDEKTKTQALGRERDDALRVARGGSVLQRVARATKWFVIGAAAGVAAAKLAR
jgi:ABC-type nickel/cobalt efflux system permease component RcnA